MNGREFLHEGIILKSDKQNSAQGSVFYVKRAGDYENLEYVLKVVSIPFVQFMFSHF